MSATPFVRAVVVTTGRTGFLPHTLAALASQTIPVGDQRVVLAGRDRDGLPEGLPVIEVRARTFGQAVDAALESLPAMSGEWLWLLHDDSAPEPEALARLLAVSRKRLRAGVIGAAQVRWDDPSRLVHVGVTVPRRGARRLSAVEQDDLDQGQHAGTEDVLAVGLAGAIVKREAWHRLQGTDKAYGVFGDSTDFCRRAWRAGFDVVVAPRARVRHAQASLGGIDEPGEDPQPRHSYSARRASEWYHALAWAPAALVPFVVIWSVLSSFGRAAFRVTAGEPRQALSEFAVSARVLARLSRLRRSRALIASAGKRAVETPLLASALDVARHVRSRELGAYEAWRAENAPSDVQKGEIRERAKHRRWTLAGLVAVASGIAIALFGTWIAPLARGDMLTGSAMGGTDLTTADLWARSWAGWSDIGFGSGSLDGTFSALMLPFSLVPGGLAMGVGLLLTLGVVFASVAAWSATGAASRSLVARAVAAIAWGVWPPFIQSISDGRVGAVLTHILLPVFALTFARALGVQRRDILGDNREFPARRVASPSAAAIAALLLAAIAAATPSLVFPLVLLVLVLTLALKGRRRFALMIPLPALVLSGPALVATWGARAGDWWTVLVREPGPALASGPATSWDLLWGVAVPPPEWPAVSPSVNVALTYLPGIALVIAALAGLVSGRAVLASRIGWVVAALGVAVAGLAHHAAVIPAGGDGSPGANGWPGPGLSLAALGLFVAACAASNPAPQMEGARAAPISSRLVGASLASLVIVIHVLATVWPGRAFGGDVHPVGAEVLPLVATLDQHAQPASRVLVGWVDAGGTVRYAVYGGDGPSTLGGRGWGAQADIAVLAPAVAVLSASGDGARTALADWGIGVIVIGPDSAGLEAALLRSPDVELVGSSAGGSTWAVADVGGAPPARAWITDGDLRTPLANTPSGVASQVSPGSASRLLELAVPADARWRATVDGARLASRVVDGRQAFEIGSADGELSVQFRDEGYRRWWWAGVVVLVLTLLRTIPLYDRRFRKDTS